jgi:MFS transporter, SP family, general alpha glucoside:H+ symporter
MVFEEHPHASGAEMPIRCVTTADHPHQIMEAFDMFLNTNFVALSAFQKRYGVLTSNGEHQIPTSWQSALFQSGQCGAFIGVFLAGPVTNRLGYRWTAILALMMMNATIFISFFVSHLALSLKVTA